jgi:glycosyltransferase involved in cell wall biosynthesis
VSSNQITDILGGRFVVDASGYAEGPSQALREFLLRHGAAMVVDLTHPLVAEGPGRHVTTVWTQAGVESERVRTLPNRPPLTYALDPLVPLKVPKADAWFGFNCLATVQGQVHRKLGRVGRVVHWSVDFVPRRFGDGLLTRAYEALDRRACSRSDGRIELSTAALEGRSAAYGLSSTTPPSVVIPMGAWLDDAPRADPGNLAVPRAVFLGHLVERMGVATFVDALRVLRDRGTPLAADIIGGGPLLAEVRRTVADLSLGDLVVVHGFVADFGQVQKILAGASVAVAPYDDDPTSFSRFADPGKLKAYFSAGLPVILTDVPPNAREIERAGAGWVVAPSAEEFADALAHATTDVVALSAAHRATLVYAQQFDWEKLLFDGLTKLGFGC